MEDNPGGDGKDPKKPRLYLNLPRPDLEEEIVPPRPTRTLEDTLSQRQRQPVQHSFRLPQCNVRQPSDVVLVPMLAASTSASNIETPLHISNISQILNVEEAAVNLESCLPTMQPRTDFLEMKETPLKLNPQSVIALDKTTMIPVNAGVPLEWAHFLTAPEETVRFADPVLPEPESCDTSSVSCDKDKESSPLLFDASPASSKTVNDSLVAILSFASSCKLSGVHFGELVDLLHLLLPKNNLPSSTHSIYQIFKHDEDVLNTVYYCNVCWKTRSSPQDKCDVCKDSAVRYFITSSILSQLRRFYARPGFVEKLKYKDNRRKTHDENIEDVYDSSVYKAADLILNFGAFSISLTWYTDGVSLFNCSSYSLWPFVFVINELPPSERYKQENLIIGGLWGDSEKPHPNVYLLPIYSEIMKLKNGFSVKPFNSTEDVNVTGVVLFGTCDIPAKALFMNMKGHAGYESCPKCFIVGEHSVRSGKKMVFPHDTNLHLRDELSYQDCVKKSVESKTECKGVLGPTLLSYMTYSNFIQSISIDSMHCTSLGVMKQLLKLWFDPKYSGEPFSLSTSVNDINRLLKGLKLPNFVERLPEDVTKPHFWKASLCRNFLLYIGLAVLKPFMKPEYYKNFSDLVNGVSILHQSSIFMSEIPLSDKFLNKFSQDFQTLYGLPNMSANIHLLRHFATSVLECGNLCITHCFKLEDLNGKLVDLAHGTTHATKQIFSNLHVVTKLPLLIASVNCQEVKMFCNKIVSRKHLSLNEKIGDYMHVVGTFDYANVHHDDIKEQLLVLFGGYEVKFCTFPRVFKMALSLSVLPKVQEFLVIVNTYLELLCVMVNY